MLKKAQDNIMSLILSRDVILANLDNDKKTFEIYKIILFTVYLFDSGTSQFILLTLLSQEFHKPLSCMQNRLSD